MAEPYEACSYERDGMPSSKCYHNGKQIEELKTDLKDANARVDKIHSETLEHITKLEERMASIETNYAVITKENMLVTQNLTNAVNNLSEVTKETQTTLGHIEGTMDGIDQRVNDANTRIDGVVSDVKEVRSQITDVKVELKAVDDKTKIDVATTWTQQAKDKILPAAGLIGGIGAIMTILVQFLG